MKLLKQEFKRLVKNSFVKAFYCIIIVAVTSSCQETVVFKAATSSMSPTLCKDEVAVINKTVYRSMQDIKRWDVIAFGQYSQKADGGPWVKRVLGLPGEEVRFRQDRVFINNKDLPLPECLQGNLFLSDHPLTNYHENEKIIVPSDSYFVVGDNLIKSADSRHYGFVNYESIIGKVCSIVDTNGTNRPID